MSSGSGNIEPQTVAFDRKASSELPIGFAGATLGAQRHMWAIFGPPEEEFRALMPIHQARLRAW